MRFTLGKVIKRRSKMLYQIKVGIYSSCLTKSHLNKRWICPKAKNIFSLKKRLSKRLKGEEKKLLSILKRLKTSLNGLKVCFHISSTILAPAPISLFLSWAQECRLFWRNRASIFIPKWNKISCHVCFWWGAKATPKPAIHQFFEPPCNYIGLPCVYEDPPEIAYLARSAMTLECKICLHS